nr:MAG TPA: hypothetical protein [Caudoviricetes sp.]
MKIFNRCFDCHHLSFPLLREKIEMRKSSKPQTQPSLEKLLCLMNKILKSSMSVNRCQNFQKLKCFSLVSSSPAQSSFLPFQCQIPRKKCALLMSEIPKS